ncbi:hypothetical protein N7517_002659 [Penicillium concentricum]|uniref:Uncharacterized protein n=1 Tax=Penicillium concentricum TaxID=293559 RepID=A0A9W9SXR5_9EURO|nr:uncharacterized protein N7517_002659 [Penicillium concentricum]KAJ5384748.1 hypothetical protein N7517_002659 [Penicillium concentricum]
MPIVEATSCPPLPPSHNGNTKKMPTDPATGQGQPRCQYMGLPSNFRSRLRWTYYVCFATLKRSGNGGNKKESST